MGHAEDTDRRHRGADLKGILKLRRGLLDDLRWCFRGGEFGRTPMDRVPGRIIISGVQFIYGRRRQKRVQPMARRMKLGYRAGEDVVHVHDLHATMLAASGGIDHKRLTYRFQGRDFRLTDVHGKLLKGDWDEGSL